jgi:replicative DNA helicase
MRLSQPIFRLKHEAKKLSREAGIPLGEALNRLARKEGFSSWSLLAARASASRLSSKLFARLDPGDLILIGARPGHGKTMMGLGLIADALNAGRKSMFFTLEYNEDEVLKRFHSLGGDAEATKGNFRIDCSDAIDADYIIDLLASADRGTVIVIDYLQLLDRKRKSRNLSDQISALKSFADKTGIIIVCISQIDRSYELSGRSLPDMKDVRLPNPVDLTLFNKACFLNDGEMRIDAMS